MRVTTSTVLVWFVLQAQISTAPVTSIATADMYSPTYMPTIEYRDSHTYMPTIKNRDPPTSMPTTMHSYPPSFMPSPELGAFSMLYFSYSYSAPSHTYPPTPGPVVSSAPPTKHPSPAPTTSIAPNSTHPPSTSTISYLPTSAPTMSSPRTAEPTPPPTQLPTTSPSQFPTPAPSPAPTPSPTYIMSATAGIVLTGFSGPEEFGQKEEEVFKAALVNSTSVLCCQDQIIRCAATDDPMVQSRRSRGLLSPATIYVNFTIEVDIGGMVQAAGWNGTDNSTALSVGLSVAGTFVAEIKVAMNVSSSGGMPPFIKALMREVERQNVTMPNVGVDLRASASAVNSMLESVRVEEVAYIRPTPTQSPTGKPGGGSGVGGMVPMLAVAALAAVAVLCFCSSTTKKKKSSTMIPSMKIYMEDVRTAGLDQENGGRGEGGFAP